MSTSTAPRLLVIEHEHNCPSGFVGEWLRDEGVALDVCRPYRDDPVPADLRAHDGLVVLGGAMGAYDDARHPWLVPTKTLIASAVADQRPVWGICLGHQLATVALGGTVQTNPHGATRGLTSVGWTAEATHDPLCGNLPRDAVAVHWNNDVVTTLPDDATLLASAPDGSVQAARFGSRAWGVQFHPEAGGEVTAEWAESAKRRNHADSAAAGALDRAVAGIRTQEPLLRTTWRPMAKAFAAQLG